MPQIHYTRFPVSWTPYAADLLERSVTSWQQVVVMEFGKRHAATDTTDLNARANLLRT